MLAPRAIVRHRFVMADSAKGHALILAAGGIVLREGSRPRIAVVRLRREKAWVLPKGKLLPGEHPMIGAKREVLEETGHEVSVHEFLGSMSYAVDGKIKIVQFWFMRAAGRPVQELMDDVKDVKWLSLKQAVETLTRAHEKVFLANVGPIALKAARQAVRSKTAKPVRHAAKRRGRRAPVVPAVPRNMFAKVPGGWIERMTQPAARRIG
jgi:8-oxo-dGTP diphosphatase